MGGIQWLVTFSLQRRGSEDDIHLLTVSFPHYFLNATGRLAEQLKSREWIVARITSISERIVDARVSLQSIFLVFKSGF